MLGLRVKYSGLEVTEKSKQPRRSTPYVTTGLTRSVRLLVGILERGGFVIKNQCHFLHLTDKGRETAEKIYERHCYFKRWLIEAGVEDATAEQEACRIEHDISEQSFQKLKKWKELGHSEEANGD